MNGWWPEWFSIRVDEGGWIYGGDKVKVLLQDPSLSLVGVCRYVR